MGLIVALCSLTLVACGGGERQDAGEEEAEYTVEVASAEFPTRQRLAQTSELRMTVRNTGQEAIPELAVTINTLRTDEAAAVGAGAELEGDSPEEADEEASAGQGPSPAAPGSFSVRSQQEGLAIPSRPVWILEQRYPKLAGETAPAGAEAAQTNTFAFGELPAGESVSAVWRLTPVQAGSYTVSYEIAAGLQGKAVAVTDDGSLPEGQFAVVISAVPPQTRVNDAGEVVPIKRSDIIGQAGNRQQRQELESE